MYRNPSLLALVALTSSLPIRTLAFLTFPYRKEVIIHMTWWTPQLHSILGGMVVAVGAFVMWEEAASIWILIFAVGATAFLWWQARSIAAVWAWTTLTLGMESMAWPIVTMAQIRMAGSQPTDEQMGTILNAVLFGLFSSVFWVTFAFGLFKRMRERNASPAPPPIPAPASARNKKKRARN